MNKPTYEELEKRVAELEKRETQLRTQAVYLERLFNSAPEAIIWHDNNDIVVNVNDEFTRMFGYTRDEAIGKRINDLVAPEEYRDHASMFSDKVLHGERIEGDSKRKRKDGTLLDVSILGAPIIHEGRQMGVFAIYRDITERKRAEEEILIQKAYLERLFNSAPEAIVWHDSNGIIINTNDEFTKLFGYSKEEALGKPIDDLVVPEVLKEEGSKFSWKVIHGERIEADTKRKRKDGTLVDVWVIGTPISHGGRQMGDYAIYRDITDRKKAEEEVLVQKTYLERLFNSAPEAIVWHDSSDCIVNVNDEFTRMFGYSREEAIGKPINDLLVPEELKEEGEAFSQKVIRGERIEADTKRKRKDGTLVDVWVIGSPVSHGGKIMGDYAIYRDITDRKRAEEEILVQKSYLENLFNSAPEGIIWHDNNDVVVNINDEFTRMFGYSREDAIGRPINDLVAPDDLRGEASRFSYMVNHGDRVAADSKRRRKDGSIFDVSILGAPIFLEGRQIGVYAIYRDITERKKAEEARIRSEAEARTARNIQLNFLPGSNPFIYGYDIAGKSIPALNVGGDYYDFIRLDEHRIAIGLGDVSGNGLPAALVMANLQATIRSQAAFDPDPANCLERANRLLYHSTDAHTFVSLFYGILDTRKHTLTYANAGQSWPIVFSSGSEPAVLKMHGLVLGVREDVSYEKNEISIDPGDQVLIYTDGISEAMNERREQFGDGRLVEIVRKHIADDPAVLIDRIIETVNSHIGAASQHDDVTMVVVRRK